MFNIYFLEKDAQMRHREMVESARLEQLIREAKRQQLSAIGGKNETNIT